MKTTKIPPAFIRYLKPRLQPFSRPTFWGTLSILFLLGVIIDQYGRYSNWLEASSEKTTNSDSLLDTNLSNQVARSQFPPEDLAIGADIDNLDLLLQEVNQNQNFSWYLSSNPQENSAKQNSQDKSLIRFQAKQQTKSDRSSLVSNSQNNLSNKNFLESLDHKNSTLTAPINPISNSITQQSVASSYDSITNPVGRLYLSNRQQLLNNNQSLFTNNNLVPSISLPTNNTEVNLVSVGTNSLTTSNSLLGVGAALKIQIDNTSTKPSVNSSRPINNLEQFGLPVAQQYNNLQASDNYNYNRSELNSNSSELQRNNLANYQIQPLNFYQLHPSNYQLQQQGLEQLNPGTLSSQSNTSGSKVLSNQTNSIDFNNSVFKSNN